jgi:hypothetical protein
MFENSCKYADQLYKKLNGHTESHLSSKACITGSFDMQESRMWTSFSFIQALFLQLYIIGTLRQHSVRWCRREVCLLIKLVSKNNVSTTRISILKLDFKTLCACVDCRYPYGVARPIGYTLKVSIWCRTSLKGYASSGTQPFVVHAHFHMQWICYTRNGENIFNMLSMHWSSMMAHVQVQQA